MIAAAIAGIAINGGKRQEPVTEGAKVARPAKHAIPDVGKRGEYIWSRY